VFDPWEQEEFKYPSRSPSPIRDTERLEDDVDLEKLFES